MIKEEKLDLVRVLYNFLSEDKELNLLSQEDKDNISKTISKELELISQEDDEEEIEDVDSNDFLQDEMSDSDDSYDNDEDEEEKCKIEDITISVIDNGFTVEVGYMTFAIKSVEELIDSIESYMNDPEEIEKHFIN